MVDDRQTHCLPAEPAALDNASPGCDGLADGAALLDGAANPHVDRCRGHLRHAGRRAMRARQACRAIRGRTGRRSSRRRASPIRRRRCAADRRLARRASCARCAAPPRCDAFEAMLPELIEGARRRARSACGADALRASWSPAAERDQFLPPARGAPGARAASRRASSRYAPPLAEQLGARVRSCSTA